ncbi:MAG: Crp/Fnr family transcriptional regulator [Lewinellaceae bacterium]|nr:Crp/Fnr family transcriptional regulator [Lewinellaceae bacterium]
MKVEPLIAYFEKLLPLDEEEKSYLEKVFKERKIKRRQYILQEGDVCKYNSFVVEGCFRMYFVDDNGKEHNLQFAVENWWIGDIGSFHSGEPSKLNIEAIENAVILQIKKEDQLKMFVDFPKFNRIFRVFTENALVKLSKESFTKHSSTAEERYIDFMERYPNFFNRISNVQIASYLGVTPEFLSTIRKKLAKS